MAEQSARVCRSDDPTIDHQMSDIGMDIIENEAGVGDDQRGALRISRCIRSQQPVYRFAYGGDMLKVDPALRLVEKAQIWTLEEELQDFPSFDLAAREPGIDITLGKTVEIERRSRSEEHTSELQSLMRISYAVFCLKKKNKKI